MAKEFDYIIVGAGSAGCVLAHRLTASGAHRVLLLEAGGQPDSSRIRTPMMFGLLWRGKYDWAYYTEPQQHADNRRMYWPRGKVLGGSSSINAMIYVRGHRDNYDEWRDLGCAGWGYDDVLPYFKKSEDFLGPPSSFHGQGGPLAVSSAAAITPAAAAFIEAACQVFSAPRTSDFNGAEQEGVGPFHYTIRDGARCSTADGFLKLASPRPQLEVRTHTMVHGIVVESGRAVGVKVSRDGVEETIRAEREIILAAGAIGSPQLLLLSGIGPAAQLRQLGISVVVDLPGVGENLQDHLAGIVGYEALEAGAHDLSPESYLQWTAEYTQDRGGPFAASTAEIGGFVRCKDSDKHPTLQFFFSAVGFDCPNTDEPRMPVLGRRFTIAPILLYPKSRGTIRLRTASPKDPPLIDPRVFSERQDLDFLVEGVKLARKVAATAPLSRYRGEEWSPTAALQSDEEIAGSLRFRVNTVFHPVGTCKMGIDAQAVVDPALRVRGVSGLRVIDGSVMPRIVGGNTNAPIIMIAEKGAALIAP